MAISITAEALVFRTRIAAVYSTTSPATRNPDLDLTFDMQAADALGNRAEDIYTFGFDISGDWHGFNIDADPIAYTPTIGGTLSIGTAINAEDALSFGMAISGTMIIEPPKTSWVKWSNIGSADFTIGRDNLAGERPMEWTGIIYDILKLDKGVLIYGANGISLMQPVENAWSYKTVFPHGTAGRNAQISTSLCDRHWFIDVLGQLWEISDKISKLDYAEFLGTLSNPVLSLDEQNERLYVCDGLLGYCYSYNEKSLGKCAPNVTGFGYKNSINYVTAPTEIVLPTIEFVTDIYDLGTRKEKTVFNLEVATEVAQTMEVSISYRMDQAVGFVQTPWVKFTPQGIAYLNCYGREFKFHFRMGTYAAIAIDQFKINGVIHGFSFLDTTRKES